MAVESDHTRRRREASADKAASSTCTPESTDDRELLSVSDLGHDPSRLRQRQLQLDHMRRILRFRIRTDHSVVLVLDAFLYRELSRRCTLLSEL